MADSNQFVRETLALMGSSEFKPCAFYQNELDLILVFTRDCSYAEMPVPEVQGLSILEDNYPEPDQPIIIGLSLYGASAFCIHHKLTVSNGGVRLYDLLHFLSRHQYKLGKAMATIYRPFSGAPATVIDMSSAQSEYYHH